MHLTQIRLANIACFEDLSIDLTVKKSGKAASWVVLLGANGTGKSTILQMIGASLLGQSQFSVIAGDVDWRAYIRDRSSSEKARVWLWLQSEAGDDGHFRLQPPLETAFMLRDASQDGLPSHPSPGPRLFDSPLSPQGSDRLYSDRLDSGWFACGYSPWRRMARRAGADGSAIPTLEESAKPFRFASLFGDGSGLTDVSDWLAGLFFRAIYPESTEADKKRFRDASVAFVHMLPGVKSLTVTKDRQVMATQDGLEIPLERLSDGYRGTISWVGDLIRRLFDAYPQSPNPLRERGVVLVDEIDLHLHPQWQRSIVEDVRSLFPNIQFIVTTHSPFIVQDMRARDRIIVLERSSKDGTVIAREDAGAVQSWSADQILSGYFGLIKGTRGEKAQREEARYEHLLSAEAMDTLDAKGRAELDHLRLSVDTIPIGDTPNQQAFFRAADSAVATLRRRRQELEERQSATLEHRPENSEEIGA